MEKFLLSIVLLLTTILGLQAQTSAQFLAISDIHLHPDAKQDQCVVRDAGADTWRSARKKALGLVTDPHNRVSFIIYLGDLPMHDLPTGNAIGRCAGQMLTELRQLSEDSKAPLLFVPGNNDSELGDYKPFSPDVFQQDTGGAKRWPMIGAGPCDKPGMPCIVPGSMDDFSVLGCYAAYPLGVNGRLRVVLLNTVLFDPMHEGYNDRPVLYARELSWLGAQLAQAFQNNERVLIGMHIPPGLDVHKNSPFWDTAVHINGTTVQNNFLDTLAKYRGIITGVLSSHTHVDGFKKLYDAQGDCSSLLISVPAVAPSDFNSTAIKLIKYDKHLRITRWDTYYHTLKGSAWQRFVFGPGDKPLIDSVRKMDATTARKAVVEMCTVQENKPRALELDIEVKRDEE